MAVGQCQSQDTAREPCVLILMMLAANIEPLSKHEYSLLKHGLLISNGLKLWGSNLDPNSSGFSSYSGLWFWLWLICPKNKVKLTNVSLRQLPQRTEYHYKKDIKIQKALVICVGSSFQ